MDLPPPYTQAVRSILEACPVPPHASDWRWISSAWLDSWANNDGDPTAIDNSPLLCSHGELDPKKLRDTKRVTQAAWEQLQVIIVIQP